MRLKRQLYGASAGIIALLMSAGAAFAQPAETTTAAAPDDAPIPPPATISDAIGAGKLIFEVRARYENVNQDLLLNEAVAETVRTRIGWETGDWKGFRGLVEMDDIRHVGPVRYNVAIPGPGGASLNGHTSYPIILDPAVTELNRLQLTYSTRPAFTATLGRQRIILDDARFIGNVVWRQDEQTFDAFRVDGGMGKFKGTYAYISRANRILGEMRDWKSDSHIVNATWSPSEAFRVQGFYYALDFSNAVANSSVTTGGRVSGKLWAGLVQLAYNGTLATQSDYGLNPATFSLNYAEADFAATYDIYTAKLTYEKLEGDGTRGFFTPLGTTHLFNGWADAFATAGGNKTHVDGLEDLNLQITVQPRFAFTYWKNTQFILRYHDFDAERTGANLASEWDAQVQAAITPRLTVLFKYADFQREEVVPVGTTKAPVSRRKAWVGLEFKY